MPVSGGGQKGLARRGGQMPPDNNSKRKTSNRGYRGSRRGGR